MNKCGICGNVFTAYEGMRLSANGQFWCKPCQDEFDSIDWEQVYERQRERSE